MNKEEFVEELKKINVFLTDEQLIKLDKYYELLIEYNKKINLTAITEKENVYLKHFYDSLTLIKAYDLNKNISICDIGTGAGFPGLVLKICFPNINLTLVDALEKRIKFLKFVIEQLNLDKVKLIHSRIEDLKSQEKFDVVVSRAVAKTNVLLELGCQLPKVNGYFILMKASVDEELENSKKAIKELNYNLEKIIRFNLPKEESKRNIVVLKKIKSTTNMYPRDFVNIKKRPL